MEERRRGSAESVLEIGGRLAEAPSRRLVGSAFAEEVSGQRELFGPLCLVDLAHCVTLHEQGVIPTDAARVLVAALLDLRETAPPSPLRRLLAISTPTARRRLRGERRRPAGSAFRARAAKP